MPGGGPHDRNYKRKRGRTLTLHVSLPATDVAELRADVRDTVGERAGITGMVTYVVQQYLQRKRRLAAKHGAS